MLDLVARHGGFDLKVKATGDLDVDQHHTVEDAGIALGEAVLAAIGNKRGINRAGYFVMPMDETLAVAAIDLSGRPHCVDRHQGHRAPGRRSANRAGARLLRRLRHGGTRQRAPQGDVRPLESPQDRSVLQGVRARAARGVLEGQADGAKRCRAPRACCDCTRRLRRRQPRRRCERRSPRSAPSVWTPAAPGELGRAHGIIVPGRRPLRLHARH